MRFNSLTFVTSGLILAASLAFAQATESLTGTVSDAMCGKTHMMKERALRNGTLQPVTQTDSNAPSETQPQLP